MQNKSGVPQTRVGDLTRSGVEASAAKAAALTPRQEKWLVYNAAFRAELLYKALKEKEGPLGKTKVWAIDAAIMASFDDIEKEFGLSKTVDRLSGRHRPPLPP